MIYLDTNVIIYAVENHPKYGKKCTEILKDINSGKLNACSSVLVLVETMNVLVKLNRMLKKEGKSVNIKDSVEAVMSLPIEWVDMGFALIRRASEYDYAISGVDYIHVATMEMNSVQEVISADAELNKVKSIRRIDPLEYEASG
ncbi:MAG: type II toxin-antitoxin system VapC family toxin [Candidatus Aenigmarchaeota archaeon]|nr:type II toxin-antitoxin system VapC family toxin [Candidatus Aenigmarchaeota archaeon]